MPHERSYHTNVLEVCQYTMENKGCVCVFFGVNWCGTFRLLFRGELFVLGRVSLLSVLVRINMGTSHMVTWWISERLEGVKVMKLEICCGLEKFVNTQHILTTETGRNRWLFEAEKMNQRHIPETLSNCEILTIAFTGNHHLCAPCFHYKWDIGIILNHH